MTTATSTRRFPLGRIVMTRNAALTLTIREIKDGLARHERGDWGQAPPEDAALNEHGLRHGFRVLSAYGEGPRKFWIITEADRSLTTVLLPQDY
jgi:hypothetical protein